MNVKRGQENVYTLSILDKGDVQQLSDNVTVEVVGKYKLTVFNSRDFEQFVYFRGLLRLLRRHF